jgi:hypothetical protein
MAEVTYYPYSGGGQIYMRKAGVAGALLPVGNASELVFEAKEKKELLQDYTKPGGGTYAGVSRIESCTVKFKLHDPNPRNVAMAFFGGQAVVTGAAVLDEPGVAYKGGLLATTHPGATGVVLTNVGATVTYVLDVDYEVRSGGVFILDGGAIADATPVLKDYSFATYYKVEALTKVAETMELFFDGFNEANDGKPVTVETYRAQMSPAKAWALISSGFGELDFEAEVLKDPTKTGVGVSQYFKAKMATR